jgi:membrane protein DedA with SNARE-associated domain
VFLVAPIIAVGAAGTLADWLAPALIVTRPLLEMALNPKIRYLALAAGHVSAFVWIAVGFCRLVMLDPCWYLLGRWFGDDVMRWMTTRFGFGRGLRAIERWFARASGPIVFMAPDGVVCLLAGATGMSIPVFVALDLAGTIARLLAIRMLADALAGPLGAMTTYVARYAWGLVGLSVGIGAFQLWRRLHTARRHAAEVP